MRNIILLLVACSTLFSCSSTVRIRTVDPHLIRKINARGSADDAQIAYSLPSKARATTRGESLRIALDSAYWFDVASGNHVSIPLRQLQRITFSDHATSALVGLGVGIMAGIVPGMMIGTPGSRSLSGIVATVTVMGYGALGGLVGLIAGAIVGVHETYEFESSVGADGDPLPFERPVDPSMIRSSEVKQ